MIFPSIFKSNRATNFFSDISYPLYIIHGVAGYMGLRLLLEIGFPIWIAMVLVVSIIFGLSWLLHIWIELPSRRLGKYLDGQSSAWWGKLKVRPSSEMV